MYGVLVAKVMHKVGEIYAPTVHPANLPQWDIGILSFPTLPYTP